MATPGLLPARGAVRVVDVLTGPAAYESLHSGYWTGRVAVVFDVLRATSTMAAWLAAGAREIIPCRTVEEARQFCQKQHDCLLIGERQGVAPEGFDYGNSPLEATVEAAAGRCLVMSTTNGTRALAAAAGARAVLAGSLANASAVALRLGQEFSHLPWTMVLAGTGEDFALEDAVGAAWVLRQAGLDSPWVALVSGGTRSLPRLLAASANGRRLRQQGFSGDVAWCAVPDRLQVVPCLRHGVLVPT